MALTWAEFEKVDMRVGIVVDAKAQRAHEFEHRLVDAQYCTTQLLEATALRAHDEASHEHPRHTAPLPRIGDDHGKLGAEVFGLQGNPLRVQAVPEPIDVTGLTAFAALCRGTAHGCDSVGY